MFSRAIVLGILSLAWGVSQVRAGDKPEGTAPLVLVDQAGKEVSIANWKFTSGTRRLEWLDPAPPGKDRDKPKKGTIGTRGPEYLEMREFKAPMFENDVTTFIPLTSLREIRFDHVKKAVEAVALAADGKDLSLGGTTTFKDINRFNIEGEVGAASLSVDKPFKLQDGYAKASVHSVRFPAPKAVAAVGGVKAVVTVRGKEKTKHEVYDLAPLYFTPTGQRLIGVLMFQKTVKIDAADIVRMTHMATKDKKAAGLFDFDVEKKDGMKLGLTLLDKGIQIEEKQFVNLLGLVGRVPAGYRLFPANIIEDVVWTGEKK